MKTSSILRASNSMLCARHPRPSLRRAAIEALEHRRLLDATAPSFIAVLDGTQTFGNTRRSVSYYDVSRLTPASTNYFAQIPTFTIWPGYEITVAIGGLNARNFEDTAALDVNPANGDTYFLAFDSGTQGVPDPVGDTQGDYDLYRFNFTRAYSDFVVAPRGRGIMYTDTTAPDGFNYQTLYGARPLGPTGLPNVTTADDGVPDGRNNADADPSNDFHWIDGLVDKIGEIARYGAAGATPFFDQQDIQFVDAQTLLLMENKPTNLPDPQPNTNDYSIRTIERISTAPGAAAVHPGDTGGYNGTTSESWESFAWTGDNFVDMDDNVTTGSNSEVDGMRYVERDGVRGVWVSERDGGGDQWNFFSLNFTTRVVDKQGGFGLDEDPALNDNLGDVDFFDVDEAGSLFIGESGFNDVPQTEPNIQSLTITDYTGTVTFGTWTVEPAIAPTVDDDLVPTSGLFAVLHRGQDRVYYFDPDSGILPDVVTDVYVYDLNTNTLIYQELNAANHFTLENRIRAFTLGDYAITNGNLTSYDGRVTPPDIDALFARINDPTLGGRFTAALGNEMFDLDGNNLLTIGNPSGSGVNGDMDYLIRRALRTEYGDSNLDGRVNLGDFNALAGNFGSAGTWASGSFNGDLVVSLPDFNILAAHFGFVKPAAVAGSPSQGVSRWLSERDKDDDVVA